MVRPLGCSVLTALLLVAQTIAIGWADRFEESLVHAAEREWIERIKEFVGDGAEINSVDKLRWTSLMDEFARGYPEAFKLPIDTGADTESKNLKGLTAFQAAV